MNVRKLLDWRKALIYTHRWMGIFFGIVFITWFVSGVAFMYVGMPQLSSTERLGHMKPLDGNAIRVSPSEAAEKHLLDADRFKIETYYDGRPIYRFGDTKVYADTGEPVSGADAKQAMDLVRRWVPQYAGTVTYDAYLEDSDQWTLQQAQRQYMPVHRISVGDPAGTVYYVSESIGEPVMKTDRRGRFWGFWSGVLHWTYFTPFRRHSEFWTQSIIWGSIIAAFMCLTGMIVGVWRLGLTARFRRKGGVRSHSPYSGWMWWHHYAGLVFGFLTFTWAFSGALSLGPFPSLRGKPITREQRRAVSGSAVDTNEITVERIRASLAAFAPAFAPKEMEFIQFRGKPYFIATRPPERYDFAEERGSNAERYIPPREQLIVLATAPDQGPFQRFDRASIEKSAAEAMPGIAIEDSTWLHEYDSYYYNQNGLKSLPVLRVRYTDPDRTWLYLDPQRGTMTKFDSHSRLNRWLYHGFHDLDFPLFFYRRPLWDIIVIFFSIGGIALSATTLVPTYRRLIRHVRRIGSFVRRKSNMSAVRSHSLPIVLLIFTLVFSAAAPLRAQTGEQAAITVHDATGGAINGAVVLLYMGTTERREATGVDGVVRFSSLPPGEWKLEVRKEGFAIAEQSVVVGSGPVEATIMLEIPSVQESLTVETRLGALDTTASSASRLELSLRETPATLNVVTQETMQERGANTAMDAIEVAGGTLVTPSLGGQLPGYQTRGFANNSILNDGIRQNSSVQSSRPVDSFLLDRVEVLKGPASLFAGEGGTAGTVNYVSKMPKPKFGIDSLVSYSSYAGRRVGMGITGPITRTLMGRFDASYSDGGGFAKPSSSKLRAMAGGLWWTPKAAISIKANGKYTDDKLNAYYGTPFINGQVDPRMRFINFNLADAFSKAHNNFGRVDADFALPNGWRLHNGTFGATQRMDYRNMESYAYNPATQKVDISTYFLIWRHDVLAGNQTDVSKTVDIMGRSVKFITGFEAQRNHFQRAKNPSNSTTVRFSVDPFHPQPIFDPKLPYLRVPDVFVNNSTFYAEAQAKLANRWTSVVGLRTEQISVDYGLAVGSDQMVNRRYHPTTGRAGLVFTATENISLYGSFSRSVEPATQFVSLSGCCGSATDFNLTPARQFETGVKATALHGRLEGTAAYFDIMKRKIPTITLVNDVPTDQLVGRQTSRGMDFSFTARPYASLLLNGDFEYAHARFAEFNEVVAGVNVSRTGNLPTNVPVVVWSLTPTQRFGPVSVSMSVRQVGERWADTANTRLLPAYATLDSWVSVRLRGNTQLTLRGRNLTDEFYMVRPSTSFGRVGAPRTFEATLASSF